MKHVVNILVVQMVVAATVVRLESVVAAVVVMDAVMVRIIAAKSKFIDDQ